MSKPLSAHLRTWFVGTTIVAAGIADAEGVKPVPIVVGLLTLLLLVVCARAWAMSWLLAFAPADPVVTTRLAARRPSPPQQSSSSGATARVGGWMVLIHQTT